MWLGKQMYKEPSPNLVRKLDRCISRGIGFMDSVRYINL